MATPASIQPIVHQPSSSFLDAPIKAVSCIVRIAKSALDEWIAALANIKDNPSALVKALKLTSFAIQATRIQTGNTAFQEPLAARVNNNINLMDTFGIFDDFYTLVSEKYRSLNLFDKFSTWSFFAADVGGVGLWLDEVRLIDLNKIANNIGTTTSKIGPSLTGFAGLGFATMGLSAVYRLYQETQDKNPNPTRSRQLVIELAWATMEVFSKTILLLALANVIAVSALTLIAISAVATAVGIISFVHSRRFDRQINQA